MDILYFSSCTVFFFFKQKTAYEMRISDWSADVCSSDLQDVIFLEETDPISSPMKAKGVGELGICGVAAAVANAVYNATGIRVRDYPITLDKFIDRLPMA